MVVLIRLQEVAMEKFIEEAQLHEALRVLDERM